MVSFFIFAFLSIPSFILGVIAVVFFIKNKKAGNPTSVAALVCGIISIILGLVGFVSMIVNMIIIAGSIESAAAIALLK